MIHPTAIIDSRAAIDPSVEVGPFSVIDAGVSLEAGCVVGPGVHITGQTHVGRENRFHAGCVIGEGPQDLRFNDGSQAARLRQPLGRKRCGVRRPGAGDLSRLSGVRTRGRGGARRTGFPDRVARVREPVFWAGHSNMTIHLMLSNRVDEDVGYVLSETFR